MNSTNLMRTSLTLAVIMTVLTSFPSFAGELEAQVGKEAVSAYAKEQLKHRLADFINKNPQVVFSKNPNVGTQGLKFVSKALAVYGFVTAKTDRDRGWSAAHLILSPEPTTALLLVGAQLIDTYMSMKSQADVAEIYREVAEIQAQTSAIMKKVHLNEYNAQIQLVSRFEAAISEIEANKQKLAASPTYLYLTQGNQKPAENENIPSAEQIEDAIHVLTNMMFLLQELELATLSIEALLRPGIIGATQDQIKVFVDHNRSQDDLRKQLAALQDAYRYFFASINAEDLKQQIENDLSPYKTELRIYRSCVSTINAVSTQTFWQDSKPSYDKQKFIRECRTRFQRKGEQK